MGEFWLVDGKPVPANGDFPEVSNHASVVTQHAWKNQLLPALRAAAARRWHWGDLADRLEDYARSCGRDLDVIGMKEHLCVWADDMHRDGVFSDKETDDPKETLLEQAGCQQLSRQTLDIVFGDWGQGEAETVRNYGRKHLGWIRVVDENVDMWEATSAQLQKAADGLHEIFRRSVSRRVFLLETHADGRVYRDVPWRVFQFADPLELAPYLRPAERIPPGPRSVFSLPG